MELGNELSTSGRCAFELLGESPPADQRYMVDRLEDKVWTFDRSSEF